MNRRTRFKYPRHCPLGHSQISWCLHEKKVFCWPCNKQYGLSECFAARITVSSMKAEERHWPSYRSRCLVALKDVIDKVNDKHFVLILAPIRQAIEKYLREDEGDWRVKPRNIKGFGK